MLKDDCAIHLSIGDSFIFYENEPITPDSGFYVRKQSQMTKLFHVFAGSSEGALWKCPGW